VGAAKLDASTFTGCRCDVRHSRHGCRKAHQAAIQTKPQNCSVKFSNYRRLQVRTDRFCPELLQAIVQEL
jgi:hypothetical protein